MPAMVTTQESNDWLRPRSRALRSWPLRPLHALLMAEQDRWVLWLPVVYGVGIGAYFLLPEEPPGWLGRALFVAAGILLLALLGLRQRLPAILPVLLLPALLLVAGFGVAQWRTQAVAAPVLERETGPVRFTGRIVAVEPQEREGHWRVTLSDLRLQDRGRPLQDLALARLTVRSGGVRPVAGAVVSGLAVLFPPGPPDLPGGFDFGRLAWFQGLGAVGIAVAPLAAVSEGGPPDGGLPAPGLRQSLEHAVARLRRGLAERIAAAMPAPEGAIAAALLTGERGAIPEKVVQDYRDSGIAHLLAISGLHLALVAGLVFVGLRGLLAFWPRLALQAPIKKWAAACALLAALGYLILTGAAVSTQRATLMAALVLLAILLDRVALSMRSVAWAAFVVLTLAPESLLSPGFQMSFAAVIALIAAYEGLRGAGLGRGLAERGGWPGQAGRLLLYGGAVFSTTVIAGLATAPFAAFHFQRVVDYGLVANLVAVPLTSFWIMPLGLLGYLLMPLGLEHLALQPMGWGIALVDRVAAAVAGWPGAVTNVPAMPVAAVVAMALGGLWLALWRRPWRLAGLVAIAAGVWLTLAVAPPDLLVDGEGRSVAVRIDDRLLFRERTALRRREAAVWARQTGLQADAPWPRDGLVRADPAGADAGTALLCDPQGCLYRRGGTAIAIPFDPDALARDCRQADAVVADFALRQRCPVPELLVDIRSLAWQGATTLRITPQGGLERQTVAARRGRRPWSGGGPPD